MCVCGGGAHSHGVIVIHKVNVARPQPVLGHELLVARGPLVLGVARQHALDAHADALGALDGAPALVPQQVEADDAVGVDVRVDGDRAVGLLLEYDFWGFCDGWVFCFSVVIPPWPHLGRGGNAYKSSPYLSGML